MNWFFVYSLIALHRVQSPLEQLAFFDFYLSCADWGFLFLRLHWLYLANSDFWECFLLYLSSVCGSKSLFQFLDFLSLFLFLFCEHDVLKLQVKLLIFELLYCILGLLVFYLEDWILLLRTQALSFLAFSLVRAVQILSNRMFEILFQFLVTHCQQIFVNLENLTYLI